MQTEDGQVVRETEDILEAEMLYTVQIFPDWMNLGWN